MGNRQESLIYIEKDDTTEAKFMSRSFVNSEIKNRAYINALGAELGLKYLASEGFNVEDLHNLHSISKLLEKYDIADIMLPNIHIDVRVIFDEKQIFIPKSHYKSEITPDIYLVLKLDKSFKHVEFLGFIESDKINFKNSNSEYYFVEKSRLKSPDELKRFIKDFTGTTSRDISEEDMLRGRELSVALADHNISEEEEKELIELLLSSDVLRDSVLEFDNFETLAYNVAKTLVERTAESEIVPVSASEEDVQNEEINPDTLNEDELLINEEEMLIESEVTQDETLVEDEIPADLEISDVSSVEDEILEEPEIEDEIVEEPMLEEVSEELPEQVADEASDEIADEVLSLEEPVLENNLEEVSIDLPETVNEENIVNDVTVEEQDEALPEFSNDIDLADSLLEDNETGMELKEEPSIDAVQSVDLPEEPVLDTPETVAEPKSLIGSIPESMQNASSEELVDNILDKLIDDKKVESPKKDLAQTVSDAIRNSLEKSASAAAAAGVVAGAAGAAAAAGEAAATIEVGAAATDGAIKLAGVAGDLVSNVVEKNVEKQQKNLDRIDYAKTDIAPDATEIPEHIKAMGDLSVAKMEANLEAEASGQFETPLDLNELKQVDDIHEEIKVEQEIVDLSAMETVQSEDIIEEHTDSIVNLSSINVNSPTKPVEESMDLHEDLEFTGMDLPNLSSYTINEDGTSNMDSLITDINFNEASDENLIDMKFNDIDNLTIDEKIVDDFGSDIGNVSGEDLFAGDKIITENLDETPVSDFASEDFTTSEEVLNLDDADLSLDEPEALAKAKEDVVDSIDPPVADDLDNFELEEAPENLEQAQDEVAPEELLSDEVNLDDLVAEDVSSDEISLDEFAALDSHAENEEVLSDVALQDAELPTGENSVEAAQDWVEDTNYDNLQDVELPVSDSVDEVIVEPETDAPKTFAVIENSTVISDRNFKVGEIYIDINNQEIPQMPENESLENLYNDNSNIAGGALLQSPGRLGSGGGAQKGALGGIMKLAGGLVVLAVVCVIGFNVAKMFKAPTEEAPQPITDDAVPTSPETTAVDNNALDVNPDNVVTMDNATDALANPTTLKKSQPQTPAAPTTKSQGSTMINISKLTWEVPDYISYNPQFKQYFQAVGKSLKLSLTSDLLLATDYAYSNEVKVSVTFAKDGVFKNAQILKSSGSTQIDNIVLQTVNQTLKALKAPHSVGNDESTTAILKIYF